MISVLGPATVMVTLGILVLSIMQSVDGQARLTLPYHRDISYVNKFNCAPNGLYDPDYTQYSNPSLWKCGVCGDVLTDPKPRSNEYNGKYYKQYPGVKAAYIEGTLNTVRFSMNTVSSGLGYIELRICHDATTESDNQECFNANLLQMEDIDTPDYSVEDTRINIKSTYTKYNVTVSVKLPEGLTCKHCVMQLHYRIGLDTKGDCTNDEEEIDGSCKLQNTFFDCADIRILPKATDTEQMPNAHYTGKCIMLPQPASAGSLVIVGTCSADNPMQRVLGLPKWDGNEGNNPFAIVFPYTSLCLQFNAPTLPGSLGSVTAEECTFAANQNFIAKKISNSFKLRSRDKDNKNCLGFGEQSLDGLFHVIQEKCDDSKPEQFWTHSERLTLQAVI